MSTGYTLTPKRSALALADGSALRPNTLGQLSPDEARAHPIARHCDIQGEPGPTLTLRGFPALDRLGMGMAGGSLLIEGDAGDDLGASMSGGSIRVSGSAGHRVGGPAPDQSRGMTGGAILVRQNAGDHAGLRMRGGIVAIGGSAGASPGYRMIAGTIAVSRGPLDHPGLEMRRGTILCLDPLAAIQTGGSFAEAGVYAAESMAIVRLLLERLTAMQLPIDPALRQGRWRLFSGDQLELGKGELWQWVS